MIETDLLVNQAGINWVLLLFLSVWNTCVGVSLMHSELISVFKLTCRWDKQPYKTMLWSKINGFNETHWLYWSLLDPKLFNIYINDVYCAQSSNKLYFFHYANIFCSQIYWMRWILKWITVITVERWGVWTQTQALMINCEWVLFLLEREMQTKAEHGSDLN